MSMLCSLYRVTSGQADVLRNEPHLVSELLDEEPQNSSDLAGVFARFFGRKSVRQSRPIRRLAALRPTDRHDLDQSWHILHYLLTGQSEGGPFPGAFICAGGTEVGRDLGYGAPRLFDPREAKEIAEFLAVQSQPELAARYRPDLMASASVYWRASDSPDRQREELAGIWQALQDLRNFLTDSASEGHGFLIEIY